MRLIFELRNTHIAASAKSQGDTEAIDYRRLEALGVPMKILQSPSIHVASLFVTESEKIVAAGCLLSSWWKERLFLTVDLGTLHQLAQAFYPLAFDKTLLWKLLKIFGNCVAVAGFLRH